MTPSNILTAIIDDIRKGMVATLDKGCFGSALILIYAGIEAMANLSRPGDQEEVRSQDFINWADKYIDIEGEEKITGEELYSARCAIIHTYGVESRKTKTGKARKIGYKYYIKGQPAIIYNPNVATDFLLLDIPTLAQAFSIGMEAFLLEIEQDQQKRQLVEKRAEKILTYIPA